MSSIVRKTYCLRTLLGRIIRAVNFPVPNLAGDARATLFFVYVFARSGDLADVVDTAAVTREVSSPRNAFFVGCREEGSREYSFRSSSPAF